MQYCFILHIVLNHIPLDYRGKTSETHGAGSFGPGEETAKKSRLLQLVPSGDSFHNLG